ncbi:unnamed protein product [Sympodiomycopsis kandeliae]
MPQDVTSREIGKGGFASVKLGQHRGSLVAIKTTVGKKSSSARVAARHEAKLLASLKHRHVVHFIAFAERDTISTLTMEYCSGGDLDAFIHSRRGMEQHIAAQLIAALHYCHFGFSHTYIIHGDVKPANVLLTDSGQVKLADFGLARVVPLGSLESAKFGGTPGYTAPEVLRYRPHGRPSDCWSLGCTLYELFTSRPLYWERADSTVVSALRLVRDLVYEAALAALLAVQRTMVASLVTTPLHLRASTPSLLSVSEVIELLAPWDSGTAQKTQMADWSPMHRTLSNCKSVTV